MSSNWLSKALQYHILKQYVNQIIYSTAKAEQTYFAIRGGKA
jgi:hypothetical protein